MYNIYVYFVFMNICAIDIFMKYRNLLNDFQSVHLYFFYIDG